MQERRPPRERRNNHSNRREKAESKKGEIWAATVEPKPFTVGCRVNESAEGRVPRPPLKTHTGSKLAATPRPPHQRAPRRRGATRI